LFLCHLGSRRQITHRLRTKAASQTCKTLFGTAGVAHGDTVANLCKKVALSEVEGVPAELTEKLIRSKVLYPYRICDQYYLIAMDGTRTISFKSRHCESCLTQTQNGKTTYFHPVLEAKLVTSNGFAFSLMSEFIENVDPGATKQDCEWKGFGSLKNLALSLLEAWRTRAVSPQELFAISTTQIQIRFDDS